jgi:hypothetical protein
MSNWRTLEQILADHFRSLGIHVENDGGKPVVTVVVDPSRRGRRAIDVSLETIARLIAGEGRQ